MSLRSLSKHRTEAKYARNWSDPNDSSKAAKHTQYAINRYHRAVRRSQREVIAEAMADIDETESVTPCPPAPVEPRLLAPVAVVWRNRTVHVFAGCV